MTVCLTGDLSNVIVKMIECLQKKIEERGGKLEFLRLIIGKETPFSHI